MNGGIKRTEIIMNSLGYVPYNCFSNPMGYDDILTSVFYFFFFVIINIFICKLIKKIELQYEKKKKQTIIFECENIKIQNELSLTKNFIENKKKS